MGGRHDQGPICPLCGREIDPSGPAVSSSRARDGDVGESHWVPFVEDLRGTPDRLVHVECYVEESGLSTLVAILTERDTVERMREHRRWQREQAGKHIG